MVSKNKLKNNRDALSLFILLGLILLITSSIVCYIVGKNSGGKEPGKIIDSIIIEEPQNTDKLPVYLTGKVLYSDGKPYIGNIFFHSKVQEARTDKNGVFLFKNIVYGSHTLTVEDDNNNVIAELDLEINQNTKADNIKIVKTSSGYQINVGINISLIEININFNKSKKEITLDEKDITVVNYSGKIVTPKNLKTIDKKIIETSNGNKVMPEGIIVLPNIGSILANGTFIPVDGAINYPEGITNLPSNITILSDKSITLSDKTVIKPDGTIIRPDGTSEGTEDPTALIIPEDDGGTETPIGEEEPDPLTWNVPIVKQGNMNWNQLTTLDIFDTNDSIIDGKIYPGVSGSYEFSIENANPYNILFSIDMTEREHETGNINLSYRLKYYNEDLNKDVYVIGDESTYLKPNELTTTSKVTLLSNSNITYVLEWIWANENNKEQDLKDGKIGISNNKVHLIDMTIYIENA